MKHGKKAATISVFLVLAIAVPGSAFGAPRKLTFNKQIRTKMYIGTPIVCDPVGTVEFTPLQPGRYVAKLAAQKALCEATDAFFQENPMDGTANPVDARLTAIVNFKWACEVGKVVPVDLAQVVVVSTTPGLEPGGFSGIANATTTANTILADGEWAFVASGHPAAAGELPFSAIRARANTDIWHRAHGKIICGVDSRGWPNGKVRFSLTMTRFPSHRSYWYTFAGVFIRIAHNEFQNAFSNLWFLPAAPGP